MWEIHNMVIIYMSIYNFIFQYSFLYLKNNSVPQYDNNQVKLLYCQHSFYFVYNNIKFKCIDLLQWWDRGSVHEKNIKMMINTDNVDFVIAISSI